MPNLPAAYYGGRLKLYPTDIHSPLSYDIQSSYDNKGDPDMAKEDKALTHKNGNGMTTAGSFMPAEFEELIGEGFASIETVQIGDPADQKLPFYLGKLIGPGEPVIMKDGESSIPTWAFHPAVKVDGKLGFAENVTQIVPAAYMLNAAVSRIYKEKERRGVDAIVGVLYAGKGKTKGGRDLNQVKVFEKYQSKGG